MSGMPQTSQETSNTQESYEDSQSTSRDIAMPAPGLFEDLQAVWRSNTPHPECTSQTLSQALLAIEGISLIMESKQKHLEPQQFPCQYCGREYGRSDLRDRHEKAYCDVHRQQMQAAAATGSRLEGTTPLLTAGHLPPPPPSLSVGTSPMSTSTAMTGPPTPQPLVVSQSRDGPAYVFDYSSTTIPSSDISTGLLIHDMDTACEMPYFFCNNDILLPSQMVGTSSYVFPWTSSCLDSGPLQVPLLPGPDLDISVNPLSETRTPPINTLYNMGGIGLGMDMGMDTSMGMGMNTNMGTIDVPMHMPRNVDIGTCLDPCIAVDAVNMNMPVELGHATMMEVQTPEDSWDQLPAAELVQTPPQDSWDHLPTWWEM
ncbi:hypothetical protein A1O1_02741 [Capronia coronata CBS 617.96]|uniref:C2H2-type domain-containing protein n=1 Tax=Capronia coronata CBS 617.96 TaxID=1182541 RepID=W9YN82_9EURO|nr:uncharacterized protein A1O1_02741 [Capronia coronata CBS 617.96]EXJ94347.1 hypothetical protein A1O1_02741 [Capronia coronata CBS 617.96]